MVLIDSHCHLNMIADNLPEILKKAKDANVKYMQTICTSIEELDDIIKIIEDYDHIYGSCGIHPNNVKYIISSEDLTRYCKHPKIIGIGETGLDYYYQTSEKQLQIQSFEQHIIASQETNLPIIVHTRDAEQDTIEILSDQMRSIQFPGLIHCFSASEEFARKMLDLGIYISISGIVTFKSADFLRKIVEFLPLDRILIETDSPYLAPSPMRGKRNEPSFVQYVAMQIAEIKSISLESVAEITSNNFLSLFKKVKI